MTVPRAGETHTDGGTITIPYSYGTISGSLGLSATLTALIGDSSKTAMPYVTISGDVNIPNGTTIAELELSTPAIGLLSLIGTQASETITQGPLELYPSNPSGCTFTLHFNGATAASAVFTGG